MDRIVLHSDANCFYASVEMLYHPEFDGKPLAVGGDPEARHGIVLTANYIAKRKGVKTGMALWQAKQACPDLIVVPPRMDLYLKFSGMLREIYSDYTNQIEPYGCDESWLDVTGSSSLKGDGRKIAEEISRRVKKELGITVSIGISWNKIFAKLGSDYKKPDGITEFNRQNYKDLKAHDFIPEQYWKNNYELVKEMMSQAEVYVYEDNKMIQGFVGLSNEYIEGIFVSNEMQSCGIGKLLLDYIKNKKIRLRLNVYQKNARALSFYQREGFDIQCEGLDEATGEKEYTML